MSQSPTDTRPLEHHNGITFLQCLEMCLQQRELVSEWQRLSGKKLIASSPLDRAIDEATGYDVAVMGEFVDFVYDFVWQTFGSKGGTL